MNIEKICIELSIDDAKKILRILLDEEPEDALKFIKINLLRHLQAAFQPC